jgi:AcrR family transcriptional regulator
MAALELFAERGFEATTVADIAARAGLTERTFFRHYADKREILFGGSSMLQDLMVQAVLDAPTEAGPIEAAAAGLRAAAAVLEHRPDFARQRFAIISATPELQERELIKMATLGAAVTATLEARAVPPTAASLIAEMAMAVFRIGFERWVSGVDGRALSDLIDDSLDQLRSLTSGLPAT